MRCAGQEPGAWQANPCIARMETMTDCGPARPARCPGCLITFEGVEGSGKTTQVRLLCDWMAAAGMPLTALREPGHTPLGESIRGILLAHGEEELRPETEVFLFAAARAQVVGQVIMPALARGDVVVSDRFTDSTIAYQGFASGVDRAFLTAVNERAAAGLRPDLTVLLDLPADLGAERRAGRIGGQDRIERRPAAYHEAVRRGYLALAAEEPDRFAVIDGRSSVASVRDQVRGAVVALLGRRGVGATVLPGEGGWA